MKKQEFRNIKFEWTNSPKIKKQGKKYRNAKVKWNKDINKLK